MKLWRSRKTPRVVFVHAGGVDGRMWHPLGERLDDRTACTCPTCAAMASTPLPPGEYSDAEDLVRMLDALRINRATLVGAVVRRLGLAAARDAGARARDGARPLRRHPLADANEWSPELEAFRARRRRCWRPATSRARWPWACASGCRAPACATSSRDVARRPSCTSRASRRRRAPLPVDLGAIAVPTLAVSGGHDLPDFARFADEIAATVPGAERAESGRRPPHRPRAPRRGGGDLSALARARLRVGARAGARGPRGPRRRGRRRRSTCPRASRPCPR